MFTFASNKPTPKPVIRHENEDNNEVNDSDDDELRSLDEEPSDDELVEELSDDEYRSSDDHFMSFTKKPRTTHVNVKRKKGVSVFGNFNPFGFTGSSGFTGLAGPHQQPQQHRIPPSLGQGQGQGQGIASNGIFNPFGISAKSGSIGSIGSIGSQGGQFSFGPPSSTAYPGYGPNGPNGPFGPNGKMKMNKADISGLTKQRDTLNELLFKKEYPNWMARLFVKPLHYLNNYVGMYLLWIVLHFCATKLYHEYCVPSTFVGFLWSPLLVPAPHCKALRWVMLTGANTVDSMWVVVGTWIASKLILVTRKFIS